MCVCVYVHCTWPCRLPICWLAWTLNKCAAHFSHFSLRLTLYVHCVHLLYTSCHLCCRMISDYCMLVCVRVHVQRYVPKQITHIQFQSCVIQFHYFNSPGQDNDQNDPRMVKRCRNIDNNERAGSIQHILLRCVIFSLKNPLLQFICSSTRAIRFIKRRTQKKSNQIDLDGISLGKQKDNKHRAS